MKNAAYKVVEMEGEVMENRNYFSGGNPPSSPSNSFLSTKLGFIYSAVNIE